MIHYYLYTRTLYLTQRRRAHRTHALATRHISAHARVVYRCSHPVRVKYIYTYPTCNSPSSLRSPENMQPRSGQPFSPLSAARVHYISPSNPPSLSCTHARACRPRVVLLCVCVSIYTRDVTKQAVLAPEESWQRRGPRARPCSWARGVASSSRRLYIFLPPCTSRELPRRSLLSSSQSR